MRKLIVLRELLGQRHDEAFDVGSEGVYLGLMYDFPPHLGRPNGGHGDLLPWAWTANIISSSVSFDDHLLKVTGKTRIEDVPEESQVRFAHSYVGLFPGEKLEAHFVLDWIDYIFEVPLFRADVEAYNAGYSPDRVHFEYL
jgi:hypothetical protein